ncbi:unnamed protein product, partial [Rotaria socialis]
MYYDEIVSTVKRIQNIESLMIPVQFNPDQVFDERKHLVDAVAKTYLRKATDDVQHLIPVEVVADGNCL